MKRLLDYARALVRNRSRRPGLPRFLTYTVTYTCNARCIMCDSWKIPSPNDLTLSEIERIFGELPVLDAVRLTGGEPFVRRDLLEIAHLAQSKLKPLALHITTNGFLTDRIVEFCQKRRKTTPLHLLVSVDGVEDKHNTVRGSQNAWSSVMETLEVLAPRRRSLDLKLAVNQTIVDVEGIEHYRLLRDRLAPLGIPNHVVMAYDTSATYSVDREIDVAPTQMGQFTTFGEFTAQHIEELTAEVERDLHRLPFLDRLAKRYYMRGIRNRLAKGHGSPNPPCVALNAHLRIFPNGDVPTCQFNSKTVGNLRQQRFADVWSSATARTQRDWVNRCPGCWAECEVVPSAVYTGDLLLHSLRPDASTGPTRLEPVAAGR